jgi:hypothetical protein
MRSKQGAFVFYIREQRAKIFDLLIRLDAPLSYVGYYDQRSKEFKHKGIILNERSQQRAIIIQIRTLYGAFLFHICAEQSAIIFQLWKRKRYIQL